MVDYIESVEKVHPKSGLAEAVHFYPLLLDTTLSDLILEIIDNALSFEMDGHALLFGKLASHLLFGAFLTVVTYRQAVDIPLI